MKLWAFAVKRALFLDLIRIVFVSLCCGADTQALSPADAAWKELETAVGTLEPPDAWRQQQPTPEEVTAFQEKLVPAARSLARKAEDFLRRYPTNEHAIDGRFTFIYALGHAVAAGDKTSEQEARRFIDTTVSDKTILEDERAKVFVFSSNVALMKQAGMRFFVEGQHKFQEEWDRATVDALLQAMKCFPNSESVYTFLLALAERSKGDQKTNLANAVLNSEYAPLPTKTVAQHILKGTKPYEIGKPLSIQFTALDGRKVDLAQLKGKVILIDFWNTGCGPCVAEMPQLKSVYEKFHSADFEIIGISLDYKENTLRQFIRERDLPWPQHFDGKGWANRFAVQYGIFAIPTLWLVDKRGTLRATDVRSSSLSGSVELLLQEK